MYVSGHLHAPANLPAGEWDSFPLNRRPGGLHGQSEDLDNSLMPLMEIDPTLSGRPVLA